MNADPEALSDRQKKLQVPEQAGPCHRPGFPSKDPDVQAGPCSDHR
jgi:hypothetical protein